MSQPMVQSSDAGLQAAIGALQDHIAQMIRAGNDAERINEEIAAGYVAQSSTVFQSKVREWVDSYKNVMRKFEQLVDGLSGVKQVLSQAEDEAQTAGGNWGASDGVYAGLSG